jgi:polysaccharide pyruvyl transferase WcaK-like protein
MNADPTRRRIALFGVFGAGNLGNECTLHAMLCNLRRYAANAEVVCICSGPEDTASSHNICAFPIREMPLPPINNAVLRVIRRIFIGVPLELYRWFRAIIMFKGTDMLIMTGTGMLGDFGIGPFGLHYDILKWSIIAKLCRCKLLFVSVGAGPIRHPLSRIFVKAALRLADYRSYRDTFSRNYLQSIGFDTEDDKIYPDLAFSLPKAMIPRSHDRNGHGAVIGVGLMTYHGKRGASENHEAVYRDYVAKLACFVTWLLERGYSVRLLIGDFVWDQRVRQDLRGLLEDRELKYDDRRIIEAPASSFEEVLSQLAGTDIVVASRFHNVLLALMLNKPVVAISYHEKFEPLMASVGLSEFCQDIEHIEIDKLTQQLTALKQNAENIRLRIGQATEENRTALDAQFDHIFKCV